MALTAKSSGGGDFDIAPAGNHVAICYGVVDLGEHEQEWQGKVSLKHRVRISWELCDELMSDGRPFSISKEYTLSLNEKATLRHDLESWRGRPFTDAELAGFDIFVLLGKPCMVNVVHKPKRDGLLRMQEEKKKRMESKKLRTIKRNTYSNIFHGNSLTGKI